MKETIINMMGGMWLLIHQAHNKKKIFLEEDDDTCSDEEVNNAIVPQSSGQDMAHIMEVLQNITPNPRMC